MNKDYDGWALKWNRWTDGSPGTPMMHSARTNRHDVVTEYCSAMGVDMLNQKARRAFWRTQRRRGLRCVKVKLVEVHDQ